jgi:hypothetical protein
MYLCSKNNHAKEKKPFSKFEIVLISAFPMKMAPFRLSKCWQTKNAKSWRLAPGGVVQWSQPATEETGALGRQIESRRGIGG